MPNIIEKPKSWTRQISELLVNEILNFPADKERSISVIISGNNRGGLKEKHPERKFTTTKVTNPDETEVLQVTRIA